MKRQYLGDSKDSFKWDYHDFLVEHLAFSQFHIVWMMTPDDSGSHGTTAPEQYHARPEILQFCHRLKAHRDPDMILSLPTSTSAAYRVLSYKPDVHFNSRIRKDYFSEISTRPNQVIFLILTTALSPILHVQTSTSNTQN